MVHVHSAEQGPSPTRTMNSLLSNTGCADGGPQRRIKKWRRNPIGRRRSQPPFVSTIGGTAAPRLVVGQGKRVAFIQPCKLAEGQVRSFAYLQKARIRRNEDRIMLGEIPKQSTVSSSNHLLINNSSTLPLIAKGRPTSHLPISRAHSQISPTPTTEPPSHSSTTLVKFL